LALQNGESNEVAYLAAAHHGKVRLSISSIAGEYIPGNNRIFAKGVWDKDIIKPFNLNGIDINQTELDMSLMQIGSVDKESWIHMVISLYKKYGIFRLAYMETIVRAADQRASGNL
jgi:CRISPR-associated endonuclease/helicase Cas3